jgi:hypothetical protein
MNLRKLLLKDVNILKELFLQEKDLTDVGINVTYDKILLEYTYNWLKESVKIES